MGCSESLGCSKRLEPQLEDPDSVPEPPKEVEEASVPEPLKEVVEDDDWVRLGGEELEEALREEWVKLVRADWLVRLAERGGRLERRQEMPPEAYVGLGELKRAGAVTCPGMSTTTEWLRVIVLSYPWLQPGHPDPHGENLRALANVLKHFVNDSHTYSNEGKPYGVLIDFAALFQVPRTPQEHEDFLRALRALNVFYSHPETLVLKITEFPDGYPNHPAFQYVLPEGANRVEYAERGWCFAESCMSGLVKSSSKVLDLACYSDTDRRHLFQVIGDCKPRHPPLHPDDFREQLDLKTFTSKKADFHKVAELYSTAFERRLGSAAELDYSGLGWDADATRRLVRALGGNSSLQTLDLTDNAIGDEGARVLGKALGNTALRTALRTLRVAKNNIGRGGTTALAEALQNNGSLQTLDLDNNEVGNQGAVALSWALESNSSLQTLTLNSNGIEDAGALALGQALHSNGSLWALNLRDNRIGDEGATALAKALRSNSSLHTLDLGMNLVRSASTELMEAAGARPIRAKIIGF